MSAYVFDNDQINRIVCWITGLRTWEKYARYYTLEPMGYSNATNQDKEALGVDLLAMNQDAVMQRYPESDATDLPGPINPQPYKYTGIPGGLFEAYELIGSFIYQCSEGNVPGTKLYKAISNIYNAMAHNMARAVISGEYR